jgi:hypothetical protein
MVSMWLALGFMGDQMAFERFHIIELHHVCCFCEYIFLVCISGGYRQAQYITENDESIDKGRVWRLPVFL